jgi:methanogenic corrinoid protein MtbC1
MISQIEAWKQDYEQHLLAGDRIGGRQVVEGAISNGASAEALVNDLVWPAMESLQAYYRADRINITQLNMATRLNRSITAQVTARLEHQASNGQVVLVLCGDDEPEELGGQICADLFEAAGYTVRFAGGGGPNDEALKLIGDLRPHLLVLFGTLPSGMPAARKLIDYLRTVNSCPNMQIMCCGGIYKRATGLAEEIGADLFAADAQSAVAMAKANPQKRATAEQQTVGRARRARKAAGKAPADVNLAEAA